MINNQENLPPTPKIRSINNGEAHADVDLLALSSTMTELGISNDTIEKTTVILDGKNRLGIKGIAFPASKSWLSKRRFPSHAEDIDGPVVRLTTTLRNKPRTSKEINKTFTHELEHLAQFEREDSNVLLGRLAIYGGMLVGAFAGNLLTQDKNKITRTIATIGGAAIGKELGYRNAPHENQARRRSTEVHTDAVTAKLTNS